MCRILVDSTYFIAYCSSLFHSEMESVKQSVAQCLGWEDVNEGFASAVRARLERASQALKDAGVVPWLFRLACIVIWRLAVLAFKHPIVACLVYVYMFGWGGIEFLLYRLRGLVSSGGWMSAYMEPEPVVLPVERVVSLDLGLLYSPITISLLANGLMFLLVLSFIFKHRKVTRVCEHGFVVEKAVPGSIPRPSPSPTFVCQVWIVKDGVKVRNGTAFMVANYVYTAEHVIKEAEKIFLRKGSKELEVQKNWIEEVDYDVIRIPYANVSGLEMTGGKFIKRFTTTYCTIHNGDVEVIGKLSQHDAVGSVEFDGTTQAGFSGAPYYLGKAVYGIHLGAAGVNLGMDGASLNSVVELLDRLKTVGGNSVTLESGDTHMTDPKMLLDYAVRNKNGKLDFRRMANDYYQVRIGGKYYTYDEEEFEGALEKYQLSDNYRQKSRLHYSGESFLQEATLEEMINLLEEGDEVEVKAMPTSAGFAYQDAETPNSPKPAVTVTVAAGPSKSGAPADVSSPKPEVLKTASPTQASAKKLTTGQKRVAALHNAVSRFTSEDLRTYMKLLQRYGPSAKEMEALRIAVRSRLMKK